MTSALSPDLPPEPTSAGAARRFVTTSLHRLGQDSFSDLAELLVSELVTHAVLHARTTVTLIVQEVGGGIRVGVADASRRGPRHRDYSEDAMTGRGLTLVDAFASSWGTEPTDRGKTIWFELNDEAMAV